MIMWSNNYPYYIPAPMLCGYRFQLPVYAHCSAAAAPDYLVPVFSDCQYYYYPSRINNFDASPILLDPPPSRQRQRQRQQHPYHYHMNYRLPRALPPWLRVRHRFRVAHPDPDPAPYPLQVRPRRAIPLRVLPPREKRIPAFHSYRNPPRLRVLAPHRNTRSIDARTTTSWLERSSRLNAQVPLQASKIRNRRLIFRNPSRFRGLAHRKTTRGHGSKETQTTSPWRKRKRSRNFPIRVPLQVSNLPKRRWIRNPSQFRASAFKKRKTHAPWAAPTESSLRVSAFQKKSHRFKKWFPLRVSNQWRKRSHRSFACFRCKKHGHFAIRCPQNMMHNKSRLSSSVSVFIGQDGLQYSPPSLICQCGLRCSLTTRKTRGNTSRKGYTCSLRSCRIFRWEDEVNKDELISVPKCGCGAGFCRQFTESGGKYFACPIKKGQGACTFFKLPNDESLINNRHVDERITPSNLTIGDCTDTFPANSVQKESRSSYVLDTAEHYPNQREISGNQKLKLMEVEFECEEDTSNKTLRKCNKRFRDGAPKSYSSFSNTVVEFINVPQSYSDEENALAVYTTSSSFLYTSDLLPLREDWLITAATNLNIELFKGWWGRLAYPPAPCLKLTESKPFYCCVFPSFDPISVPRIMEEVDWQSQNRQNPREILEGSLMFGAISDQFVRVAIDIQNKLISLLKSSDFRAHDYMDREANITFTALDQLQVQSKTFCERVKKFIRSASNLDKAEGFIIPNDQSYNDSQDHYISKKRKRDDLISDYEVAKEDMETCKERLHSVSEESSRQTTMLFQVEAKVAKVSSSEAQISIDLLESEKPLRVAEKICNFCSRKKKNTMLQRQHIRRRGWNLGSSPDK